MKPNPKPCKHGEVECDVARSTIRCRICGAWAKLPEGTDPR